MNDDPQTLDTDGIAAAAAACLRTEVAAGCRMLQLAALWADWHPAEGVHERTALALAGERTMRFGGDGTPDVAEFAPHELGLGIGMSPAQATSLIADAVDLRHRMPLLWARVQRADVPAWQARRVADRTRGLSRQQAAVVDRRLSRFVGQLSRTRLDNLINAELLRVDRHRAEQQAAAATRFPGVRVSAFPWSSSQSRRMDVDHTIPYARPPGGSRGGPPGRTGMHTARSVAGSTGSRRSAESRSGSQSPERSCGGPLRQGDHHQPIRYP